MLCTTSSKIGVVTDSSACVPPDLVREYDIRIVPHQLTWDGQTYLDGLGMMPAEFYRRFGNTDTYPTTAQPTVVSFTEAYARLAQEVEGIVSIHPPQCLTTTVQVARLVAEGDWPVPIRVVDARTAAAAQGFVVLAAARAAKAGGGLEEVAWAAEACAKRVGLYFTLETLRHLRRGGRIGQAGRLLGSRLRIQPVLKLSEGQVQVVSLTRSRQRARERILEEVARRVERVPVRIAVFHADVAEEARLMAQEVEARFHCVELLISEFTPVMGAHTGPGIVGVAYCLEESQA